jgi:hypothetical protein
MRGNLLGSARRIAYRAEMRNFSPLCFWCATQYKYDGIYVACTICAHSGIILTERSGG